MRSYSVSKHARCDPRMRSRVKRLNGLPPQCVRYPKSPSEFEIQSYLYEKLKAAGVDVRGAVTIKGGQLDLVIFVDGKAVRAIEVKRKKAIGPRTNIWGRPMRDQQCLYRDSIGIPVDVVVGLAGANRYIASTMKRVA